MGTYFGALPHKMPCKNRENRRAGPLPVFHGKNEISFHSGPDISARKVRSFLPAGTEHHPWGWWDTTPENGLKKDGDQARGIDWRRKVYPLGFAPQPLDLDANWNGSCAWGSGALLRICHAKH
jgi:hypothetical protein